MSVTMRDVEKQSIREFIAASCDHYVKPGDKVLDFGCGQSPYRDLVEAEGAVYQGFDRVSFPGSVGVDVGALLNDSFYDVVICTQVLQYVPSPVAAVLTMRYRLKLDGLLLLTYATNWPEVEKEDLWRFTTAGMETLLGHAGLAIKTNHSRAEWEGFSLGGAAVARRPT